MTHRHELPDKSEVAAPLERAKSLDASEAFKLTSGSLKDDLASMRKADSREDTSSSHLPLFKLTDTKSSDDGLNTDLNFDPLQEPIYDEGPIYTSDPTEVTKRKYNDWLTKGENDEKHRTDSEDPADTKNEPDKEVRDNGRLEKHESGRTVYLDNDVELEVGKDGKVKKITYVDSNGKKHTLTADQWRKVKSRDKDFHNGFRVGFDENLGYTIELGNGKLIQIDRNGRFKIYLDSY